MIRKPSLVSYADRPLTRGIATPASSTGGLPAIRLTLNGQNVTLNAATITKAG